MTLFSQLSRSLMALIVATALVLAVSHIGLSQEVEAGARSLSPALQELMSGIKQRINTLSDRAGLQEPKASLGPAGFKRALNDAQPGDPPIVAMFISDVDYHRLRREITPKVPTTAVFSNPRPLAMLALAEALRPRGRHSVIQTVNSEAVVNALSDKGVQIIADWSLKGGLKGRLTQTDLLLALPDSSAIHSGNINPVITTLYRGNAAVIGYSNKLVKVGALASIFPTRDSQLMELERMIDEYQTRAELPSPRYSENLALSVNTRLARSLGYGPIDQNKVLTQVKQQLAEWGP